MIELNPVPPIHVLSLPEQARARVVQPFLFGMSDAALRQMGNVDAEIEDGPLHRYQIHQDPSGGLVVAEHQAYDDSHMTKVAVGYNRGEWGELLDLAASRERTHFNSWGDVDNHFGPEILKARGREIQILELSPLVVVRHLRRATQLLKAQRTTR